MKSHVQRGAQLLHVSCRTSHSIPSIVSTHLTQSAQLANANMTTTRRTKRDEARRVQQNKAEKIRNRATRQRRQDRSDAQEINRDKLRRRMGVPDDPTQLEVLLHVVVDGLQQAWNMSHERKTWIALLVVLMLSAWLWWSAGI